MAFNIQTISSNWSSQVTALSYQMSQWDRDAWNEYLTAFPHVQQDIDRGEARLVGWKMFCEELFHRLYAVPMAIRYDQLRPEVLWAHELHRLLERETDITTLQMLCRNDKEASGQAAWRFSQVAFDALPTPPKSFQSPQTIEAWQEEYKANEIQIKAFKQTETSLQAQLTIKQDQQMQVELQRQIEQVQFDRKELEKRNKKLKRQIGNAKKIADQYAEEIALMQADLLVTAIRESIESVRTLLGMLSAFGWGDGLGTLNCPGNAQLKQKTAQRLQQDDRFRQIAEAAGRFKTIAAIRQGAKKSQTVPTEANGFGLGNQLSRVVPSEWVRMAIANLRSLFFKDYVDESLNQVEFSGAVDQQQGAVVICLDKSGSMTGKNEIDSTALALALVAIAQSQNRASRVILFDSKVRYIKDVDPQQATHEDLIEIADRHYSGGTNFMEPLNRALEAIESSPQLREADVVFITDGQADVTDLFSETWRQAQSRVGFRVQTLVLGNYVDPVVLDRFSDTNIHIQNLDDAKVHQVLDI